MSWIRIRIRISPDESGSGFDFYHTNPDPRIRTQIRIAACKCIFSSLFVKHVDSKSALHVKSAHQNEAFFQDFFFLPNCQARTVMQLTDYAVAILRNVYYLNGLDKIFVFSLLWFYARLLVCLTWFSTFFHVWSSDLKPCALPFKKKCVNRLTEGSL